MTPIAIKSSLEFVTSEASFRVYCIDRLARRTFHLCNKIANSQVADVSVLCDADRMCAWFNIMFIVTQTQTQTMGPDLFSAFTFVSLTAQRKIDADVNVALSVNQP